MSNSIAPPNSWTAVSPCTASSNGSSYADSIVITGVPASIVATNAWGITLNDGEAPPNFTIDHYDSSGNLIDHPMALSGVDGGVAVESNLSVNGVLTLSSVSNLDIPGGTAGQFLSTNGAGVLSWATASGGSGGGPPVAISDTPSAAVSGDLWWDSVGGQLYVYFTDSDSSQWVVANNGVGGGYNLPTASTTVLGGVKVDGTTIKAAADGTLSAPIFMGDNRIINGDMGRDQRNNGAGSAANNVYTIDRWYYGGTQASKGTWQRAPSLQPLGFPYYLAFTSSSAYAVAAGDAFVFKQPIEADMISDFGWGTASAQPVTLSFWVATTIAGTYGGAIGNNSNSATRSFPFSFTIAANAWTKIIITIPGDTAGVWTLSGNGVGACLFFDLGTGATYRASAGAWANGNFVGVTGAASILATNGAEFQLTGVKLEIGSVATPFNRQSLAKSLADCQRYFCKTYRQDQVPGAPSTDAQALSVYSGQNADTGNFSSIVWAYPVTMRASPTINLYSPHTGVGAKAWAQNAAVDLTTTTLSGSDMSITLGLAGVGTQARDLIKFHAIASAEL